MGRCWGKGHGTPRGASVQPPAPLQAVGGAVLPAHPLQVPGSAGTPLCRACLHSRRAHSQEGATPAVPEGPPRGACGPPCPRPPRPASPKPRRAVVPPQAPRAATSASCGCQGKQSFRKAGLGVVSQEAPRACQLPAVGFRFQGPGEGGPLAGVGERMPVLRALAWSWSGRGLIPGGSSRPRPLCPSVPAPCSAPAPRPLPTLPRICWVSCFLAGPGASLAPRTCSLTPCPQLGACSDLGPAEPCRLRRAVEPPSSAFRVVGGSPGLEPVRLALGWHFCRHPLPSWQRPEGSWWGFPSFLLGGPGGEGGGGFWRAFWEEEPVRLGAAGWGNAPVPQREPRVFCLAMLELAYSSHGESLTSGSGLCLCTMGTVSDFADCNLTPARALQSLLCSGEEPFRAFCLCPMAPLLWPPGVEGVSASLMGSKCLCQGEVWSLTCQGRPLSLVRLGAAWLFVGSL